MTPFNYGRALAVALLLSAGQACYAAPQYGDGSNVLTDGLDNLLKPSPPDTPPQPDAPSLVPGPEVLDDLLKQRMPGRGVDPNVGEDVGQAKEAPLERIEQSMHQASRLINRVDTSGETGRVQQQIVDDLDKLIAQMEKQCQGGQCNNPKPSPQQESQRSQPKPGGKSSQASASQSSSAAGDSTARLGKSAPTAADKRSAEELMKEAWGHLPQRLREQMLQSSSDEFLPEYREELKQYFKRLAEEQAAGGVEN